MKRRGSMRAALVAAFATVTTVPMIVAAIAGVWFFHQSISAEAARVSAEHMRMATQMLEDRMAGQVSSLRAITISRDVVDALSTGSTAQRERLLTEAAGAADFTYTLLVDTRGRVIASSSGQSGGAVPIAGAVATALNGRTGSVIGVIDQAELARRDAAAAAMLEVKAAPGGTVRHKTLDGALAITSAVPVVNDSGRAVAAIVGVEVLNRSTGFIDEATKRLGGTVTVFQHEVRIATSVRLDNGDRAVGTVASDKVQQQVLTDGKPFEGIASVVGKPFQASYKPLRDPDGKIIGMLYVGFPTAPYDAATRLFALRFLGTATLGMVLAVLAGFTLSAVLSRPVSSIAEAAGSVAQGDLTAAAPVDGTSETAALGVAFNAMVAQLSGVLSHASATAGRLRSIAGDLRAQSGLQAEGANRQASAIAETTATLEELAATYGAVASGAEEVMRRAEDAVEAAQQGRSTLDESLGELERLFHGAEQVAEAAGGVSEASSEIAGAIGIIESIAEQTKILALNAAIEAARAGEAGRGFAVVAQEIRQLADSVSDSTRRIERMVTEIQGATRGLADLSRDQNGLAEHSVGLGRRTADSFGDILEQMMSTAAAARQIASAAVQQRTATGQVVEAMHQVSGAASDTAQVAQRVDTAAAEVLQSGAALDDSLKGFKL